MTRYLLNFLSVIAGLVIVSGAAAAVSSENSIAALVNEQVITTYDLDKQVNFFTNQLEAEGKGGQLPPAAVIRKQVLQQMIDIDVQTWVAKQSSIKVSNSQINQAVAQVAKQSGLTEKQLYDKMQSFGLTINEYRDQVKDQLYIHTLVQRDLVPTISVTDEQVNMFKQSLTNQANMNTEYNLADILIAIPDAATSSQVQQAKKKAQDLLDDINAGDISFAKAAEGSSDSQNALQGGSIGWRKYSELPNAFAAVVVDMKPGDVAGPIRAPNGYHLLTLTDMRKDDSAAPPSDEQIRQALFSKKLFTAQQGWLAKLKAQSYIKVFGD